jgi:hypothetical protein
VQARRIGLSPLGGRYLIVDTCFNNRSARRDGVAAIWAPKSTVEHRRITRNSRALVQPGEVFLGTCSKTLLKRETYPTITTATSSCSPPDGRRTQAVSESAAFTTEPFVARAQIRSAVTYLVNPSVARSSRPPRSSASNSTGNASPDPISGFLRCRIGAGLPNSNPALPGKVSFAAGVGASWSVVRQQCKTDGF